MVAVRRRVTLAGDHQPVFSFVRVDPAGATNGDEPKLKRPTNVRNIYIRGFWLQVEIEGQQELQRREGRWLRRRGV